MDPDQHTDPDPIRSETFGRIHPDKIIPDPGSSESIKNLNLNSFFASPHTMQPNTLTKREYKGNSNVQNIRKISLGSFYESETN